MSADGQGQEESEDQEENEEEVGVGTVHLEKRRTEMAKQMTIQEACDEIRKRVEQTGEHPTVAVQKLWPKIHPQLSRSDIELLACEGLQRRDGG